MCTFDSSYTMTRFKKQCFPVHLRLDHAASLGASCFIAWSGSMRNLILLDVNARNDDIITKSFIRYAKHAKWAFGDCVNETVYAQNFHQARCARPPQLQGTTRLDRLLPAARDVFGRRLALFRPNVSWPSPLLSAFRSEILYIRQAFGCEEILANLHRNTCSLCSDQ